MELTILPAAVISCHLPMLFLCMQFSKEAGHNVEECKLRVVYVAPPGPPSPVREGSDEDSSPDSVSENGHSNVTEFTAVSN
jgi:hypothetical protein